MLLGQIEGMIPGEKDAIHAAIIWSKSTKHLNPGIPVKFTDFDEGECEECTLKDCHGIVDPFGKSMEKEFAVILDPTLLDGPMSHHFIIKESNNGRYDGWDECRGCS